MTLASRIARPFWLFARWVHRRGPTPEQKRIRELEAEVGRLRVQTPGRVEARIRYYRERFSSFEAAQRDLEFRARQKKREVRHAKITHANGKIEYVDMQAGLRPEDLHLGDRQDVW